MRTSPWRQACWPIASARGISGSWSGSIVPAGRLRTVGGHADYIHPWLSPDEQASRRGDRRSGHAGAFGLDAGPRARLAVAVRRGTRTEPFSGLVRPMAARSSSAPIAAGRGVCLRRPSTGAGADEELLSPRQQLPTDWSRDGRFILYQTVNAPPRDRTSGLCRWSRGDNRLPSPTARATSGRRSSRPTDGGWLTCRTSSGSEKSGFRGFRRRQENGRSRPRVEASRSGGATVESCFTSRGTSS